jgi:hypothetical protein
MTATVRPDKFRQAIHAKVDDATWRLLEIRESERPILTPNIVPAHMIGHFLAAARGVYQTAQTFAEGQGLPFDAWYRRWLQALSNAERGLWRSLTEERDAQIHGEGPALVMVEIDVTDQLSHYNYTAPPHGPLQRPRMTKPGQRFAAYPGRLASEVCDDFLKLARRFVDDFSHDHAAHIPSS